MTASYTPINNPEIQFMTNNGMQSLAGGQLFVYLAGTTTKTTTWKDAFGVTANSNPIILDSNGRCTLFALVGTSFKLVLTSATDTDPPTSPFWTVDNIATPDNTSLAPFVSVVGGILNIQSVQLNDTNNVGVLAIVPTGLKLVSDLPILDSSGNEYLAFNKAPNAVNEFTIQNSATGNAPVLAVTGSDSNINLNLLPKGNGSVEVNGINLFSNMSGSVNTIRNPMFTVAQRGLGPTNIGVGSPAYGLDGWIFNASGAASTWARVASTIAHSSGVKFSFVCQITGVTSNTGTVLEQRIYSRTSGKLASQICTFQATITNNSGSALVPVLATFYASALDNWSSPTTDLLPTNLTSIASGTTATVAYTFLASSNAINGYRITLSLPALTTGSAIVNISGVDLRATPSYIVNMIPAQASIPIPEILPFQADYSSNLAFYIASTANGVSPTSGTATGLIGGLLSATATSALFAYSFPIALRNSPSITIYDTAGTANKFSTFSSGTYTPAQALGGSSNIALNVGPTSNQFYIDVAAGTTGCFFNYTASSEL